MRCHQQLGLGPPESQRNIHTGNTTTCIDACAGYSAEAVVGYILALARKAPDVKVLVNDLQSKASSHWQACMAFLSRQSSVFVTAHVAASVLSQRSEQHMKACLSSLMHEHA